MIEPLLRIQFDETSLCGRLSGVDSKLEKHEQMILELQKLLKGIPNQDISVLMKKYDEKINELDAKNQEFDSKINEINDTISKLEKKFDAAINDMNDLKSNLDDRFSQLTDFFNIKLRQQHEELSGLIPQDDIKFENFENRIKNCEKDIKNNQENINFTRTSVSQIATSIASLTGQKANLDESLPQTMNESIYYVKSNFSQVYKELQTLKDRILTHNSKSSFKDNSKSSPTSPRLQIFSPRVSPSPIATSSISTSLPVKKEEVFNSTFPAKESQKNEQEIKESQSNEKEKKESQSNEQYNNLMVKQKENLKQPMILNINKGIGQSTNLHNEIISKPAYDLSLVRPYQPMTANWQEKPELPPIRQFIKLEEAIDHIYRTQPPLQAYLNAMHKKVVENASKIEDKIEKDAVNKMFQRFQSIVGELKSHIDGLKKNLENTASRDEINDIFEDLLNETRSQENQTAIGRVRCIACGREMNQVAGAMTEAELSRALGNPPNSIAHRSTITNVGVSFNPSSRGKMDSEIVESPRSVRPYKQKKMKAMIKPI